MNCGLSSKMTPSCKWPIELPNAAQNHLKQTSSETKSPNVGENRNLTPDTVKNTDLPITLTFYYCSP